MTLINDVLIIVEKDVLMLIFVCSSVCTLVCPFLGYVPSREMRGLSGQTLDSTGKRSSMMWISANQGPGEAHGHGQDEDEDEGLNSEDRMSEIERRNSMYPRHLQSCYPMENLTDSTGVSSH